MSDAGSIGRDIVVVGASAGGVEAMIGLFEKLPADLPAALAVVIHRHPERASQLVDVLDRHSVLPVTEPRDRDVVELGHIYLGPQDYHLLMEGNRFRLDKGPKRHHTRPAVDPLFESAARAFGPRVVGLVLSGGGADGVNGLIAVSRAGGVSLAQDPAEAKNPSMPIRAIYHDDVDAVLPLARLADAIVALATEGVLEGVLSANERREARRA
jgi:two-component system chemotaxis response regulator CheB